MRFQFGLYPFFGIYVQIKACREESEKKIQEKLAFGIFLANCKSVTAAMATAAKQITLSFVWNDFIIGYGYPTTNIPSKYKVVIRLPQHSALTSNAVSRLSVKLVLFFRMPVNNQ